MKFLIVLFFISCGKNTLTEKTGLEFEPSPRLPSRSIDAPTPRTPRVTFNQLKEAFLERNCIGCHADMGSEESFLTRLEAGSPEKSLVYIKIDNGSMPPFGMPNREQNLKLLSTYILELAGRD